MAGSESKKNQHPSLRFNVLMAGILALFLLVAVIGLPMTRVHVSDIGVTFIAVCLVFGIMSPLLAYWHQKGQFERRDAVLVLYWEVLVKAIVSYPIAIAARMHFPLQDSLMCSIDRFFGVSVPGLMVWANSDKWLERLFNYSYMSLTLILLLALLLPPLAGKRLASQRFLLANALAFAIGIPFFAALPVLGPWSGLHYGATAVQAHVTQVREVFRQAGSFQLTPATDLGIISFPSFHVFWAIASAWVLGQFRWLKWPTAVLAILITVSTMTTGYHYFADVLGGVLMAAITIGLAYVLLPSGLQYAKAESKESSAASPSETSLAADVTAKAADMDLVQ